MKPKILYRIIAHVKKKPLDSRIQGLFASKEL